MCDELGCIHPDNLFLDCNMHEAIIAMKYPQKWIEKQNRRLNYGKNNLQEEKKASD